MKTFLMRDLVEKENSANIHMTTLLPRRLTFPRENINTIQMNAATAPFFNIFVGSES